MTSDNGTGRTYWRSLDHLEDTPEFREMVEKEFRFQPELAADPISRRSFLHLMGASVALATFSGCVPRRKEAKVVPYGDLPEDLVIGRATYYASSIGLGADVQGILAACHQGRPTKIEGNPTHQESLGKTGVHAQAEILNLYDPFRSQAPRRFKGMAGDKMYHTDTGATLEEFSAWWQSEVLTADAPGAGVGFVYRDDNSPTTRRLRGELARKMPGATWYRHDPANDEQILEGTRIAFGVRGRPIVDYSRPDVIVSVDCDFLGTETGHVRATREFTSRRNARVARQGVNRLYALESQFTVTGSNADHRWPLRQARLRDAVASLAARLGVAGVRDPGMSDARLETLVADLKTAATRGGAVVVCGRRVDADVQALVHAINDRLGANGSIVTVSPCDEFAANNLTTLLSDLEAGRLSTLVTLEANVAYDAPGGLRSKIVSHLGSVGRDKGALKRLVHFGRSFDETAMYSTWHINRAEALESWGDLEGADGRVSLQQPMIDPIFKGLTEFEFLSRLAGGSDEASTLVAMTHKLSTRAWKRAVHDGFVSSPRRTTTARCRVGDCVSQFAASVSNVDGMELVFALCPKVWDGRFADNGWLQELPDPVTKVTWDNPVLMSPATAKTLGTRDSGLVELTVDGRLLKAAVWTVPGMPDGSLTIALGYGRTGSGPVGRDVGFDSYQLRGDNNAWSAPVAVKAVNGFYEIASTQDHGVMMGDDRQIVQEVTSEAYRRDPQTVSTRIKKVNVPKSLLGAENKSLHAENPYDTGYQWGMSIDLTACTGCGTCTIACQAENNISVVGKDQVLIGREMHWIRMDRYFVTDKTEEEYPDTHPELEYGMGEEKAAFSTPDEVRMVHQPVACMHCENAPCEEVCPVAATTHSEEGLNDMAYNRCVGTRYCSNNCPYKVRRYNYFHYSKETPWAEGASWYNDWSAAGYSYEHVPEVKKLAANPHVTVRSRGVMEKCTFCVQRINQARTDSRGEGRRINSENLKTACEQACPASAIVFGDLNDFDSAVSSAHEDALGYKLLDYLNVKPRTVFQARVVNPNPSWKVPS